MNGHKNIWVLKPASPKFFAGDDITLHTSEKSLFQAHEDFNNKLMGTEDEYQLKFGLIAQKYIENPLKYKSRKMDLRMWVLVSDFNPMTVWLYKDFWIRLAMDEYEDDDDTLDVKKHLTNASIPRKIFQKEGGDWAKQLEEYVKGSGDFVDEFGLDIWENKVRPSVDQLTRSVFEAVREDEEVKGHRKNSFELFGLDVMIDEEFDVWLLEINRGPYMDAYCKTSRHVSEPGVPVLINRFVIEDTIKVLLDWENDKEADTGGWNLIT